MTADHFPSQADTVIFPEDELRIVRLARQLWGFVWRVALIVSLGYVCYLGISHYFIQTVRVDGISMYPTLRNDDYYLLQRWYYHFYRDPAPRDIVVIKDPSDQTYAVKRIIAGPGDCVYVTDGDIFVNGKRLDEPYLPPRTWTFPAEFPNEQWMIACQQGEYIVMGDNRINSFDSRYYGVVPKNNILGIIFH